MSYSIVSLPWVKSDWWSTDPLKHLNDQIKIVFSLLVDVSPCCLLCHPTSSRLVRWISRSEIPLEGNASSKDIRKQHDDQTWVRRHFAASLGCQSTIARRDYRIGRRHPFQFWQHDFLSYGEEIRLQLVSDDVRKNEMVQRTVLKYAAPERLINVAGCLCMLYRYFIANQLCGVALSGSAHGRCPSTSTGDI
jgi:hypothetical protein